MKIKLTIKIEENAHYFVLLWLWRELIQKQSIFEWASYNNMSNDWKKNSNNKRYAICYWLWIVDSSYMESEDWLNNHVLSKWIDWMTFYLQNWSGDPQSQIEEFRQNKLINWFTEEWQSHFVLTAKLKDFNP